MMLFFQVQLDFLDRSEEGEGGDKFVDRLSLSLNHVILQANRIPSSRTGLSVRSR